MVPLQEHQRPAAVLMQQLLSALLHGQLSLSDLLALHQNAAHSYGLHHGIHTAGLAQVYILDVLHHPLGVFRAAGVTSLSPWQYYFFYFPLVFSLTEAWLCFNRRVDLSPHH